MTLKAVIHRTTRRLTMRRVCRRQPVVKDRTRSVFAKNHLVASRIAIHRKIKRSRFVADRRVVRCYNGLQLSSVAWTRSANCIFFCLNKFSIKRYSALVLSVGTLTRPTCVYLVLHIHVHVRVHVRTRQDFRWSPHDVNKTGLAQYCTEIACMLIQSTAQNPAFVSRIFCDGQQKRTVTLPCN